MTEYREPDEQLSEHFWLNELTQSETAEAHGITIRVELESDVDFNLRNLVSTILQPLRYRVGHPLKITSGYRPPEVNKLVGGAETSQHLTGEAADIYSDQLSLYELSRQVIRGVLPYDQMIAEYDEGVLHISRTQAGDNRRQALSRYKTDDGYVYKTGIIHPNKVPEQ